MKRHSMFRGPSESAEARRDLVLDRAIDAMLRALIENKEAIIEARDQLRSLESLLRQREHAIETEAPWLYAKFPALSPEEREVLADTGGWGKDLLAYWDEYQNERAANRF
jgi:hypothetical protein